MHKKGYWGKKQGFVENHYAEGTLRKFGHFGKNGAFGKNECKKGTLGENWAVKVKRWLI